MRHDGVREQLHTVDVRRKAVPTQLAMSARLNTLPRVGRAVVTLIMNSASPVITISPRADTPFKPEFKVTTETTHVV